MAILPLFVSPQAAGAVRARTGGQERGCVFGKGVRGCDTADRAALVPERPVLVWVGTDTGTPEGHPRTGRMGGWPVRARAVRALELLVLL